MKKKYKLIHFYVDVMNWYYGIRDKYPNMKVDWPGLFNHFLKESEKVEVFFVCPQLSEPIDVGLQRFYDNFKNPTLLKKLKSRVEVHIDEQPTTSVFSQKHNRHYGRKDHVDATIQASVVENAALASMGRSEVGKIVIGSGDRDHIPAIDKALEYGRDVAIIAVDQTVGSELKIRYPTLIHFLVQ